MQDDTTQETRPQRFRAVTTTPRGRRSDVEMTFWTSLKKRELLRGIAHAEERTLRSLMNEGVEWLIVKYRKP